MIGAARQRLRAIAKSRIGPFVASRQPRRVDLPHERWGLSIGANGTLWSGSVDLRALAEREGTPLHVVRADLLDRNASAALGPREREPARGCDIFYSYKTNPIPEVLRRLHQRGIGAEVISPFELWLACWLDVPAERIIYNGPGKSIASLRDAIRRGIRVINANSASEAALIGRLAAEQRQVAHLGLRITLPGMWGGQFGIDANAPHAVDAVRRAIADPCTELLGLHFHRGISIRHRETMVAYIGNILAFCDRLRAETGWHPELLDLGGSLPCPTVAPIPERQFRLNRALGADLTAPDPDECLGLAEASELVAAMVTEHSDAAGLPRPQAVLEPGRALTGDTQFLLATILDIKDDSTLPHAVLDAGMNLAEPVPGEFHQLFSVSAPGAAPAGPYRLVGPICTPADVLYHHWRLPRLEPGHVIAIMDSGAYFVPFSTTFSFPRPAIVLQDGGEVVRIRRREEFDGLVRNDVQERGDR